VAVGAVDVEVRFFATDPRVYDNTGQSASAGFPAGGVGRTYSRTYPRVYGAAGSGGRITAVNNGSFEVPWTMTIAGPWVNPTVEHLGTGVVLSLAVSIGSGETLTLDSGAGSVFLGTAHRLNAVAPGSVWPTLGPGVNEIRVAGASGTGTAVMSWRSGSL